MTYGISLKAATKEAAIEAMNTEFVKIRERDPVHVADTVAVQNAAYDLTQALADDDTKDITVSISGNVSVDGAAGDPQSIVSVSATINLYLTARPVKAE